MTLFSINSESDFIQCMLNCLEYAIESSNSPEEASAYIEDIDNALKLKLNEGVIRGFINLADSGVFHDAVGEFEDVKDGWLIVDTDY